MESTAQRIRKALKAELGTNNRQVSVRADGGLGATVTIKDLSLDWAKVHEIAHSFERIRRCEITGDILGGGNTFISVSYDWQILKAARDEYAPAIAPFVLKAQDSPGTIYPVGQGFGVSVDQGTPWIVKLWSDDQGSCLGTTTDGCVLETLLQKGFKLRLAVV